MKLDKTIEVLQQHNKWRKGEANSPMVDPTLLSEAMDRAIELLIGISNRSKINQKKFTKSK